MNKTQFRREAFRFGLQWKTNHCIRSNFYRAYKLFFTVIEENSLQGTSVDQLPGEIFKKFVATCALQCDEFDLHLRIAFIRIVLIRCGRDPETLTDLRARRMRKRVRNSPTGRYQFQRFPVLDDV